MAKWLSLDVQWVLDIDASSKEVAAVEQIVLDENLPGQVKATYLQKSLGDLPWVLLILASVTVFLKGFLEEAGRNSYKDLRRILCRLASARRKGPGRIMIWEIDSYTTIVLPEDLSEEAFEQLTNIPLENIDGKYWVWDSTQRRWNNQSSGGE